MTARVFCCLRYPGGVPRMDLLFAPSHTLSLSPLNLSPNCNDPSPPDPESLDAKVYLHLLVIYDSIYIYI